MELKVESQTSSYSPPAPKPARPLAPLAPDVQLDIPQREVTPEDLRARLDRALRDAGTLLDQHSLELDVDHTTGRTVGRIVDSDSGEILVQIPSKEMLALIARVREALGPLVDEVA